MGRPVAISYRMQPTPLEEKGGDEDFFNILKLCTLYNKQTLQRAVVMCKHGWREWAQCSLLFHPGRCDEEAPCGLMMDF